VLEQIDLLVKQCEKYKDPKVPPVLLVETLYHIYLVTNRWLKLFAHDRAGTLNAGLRFDGDKSIQSAMADLQASAEQERRALCTLFTDTRAANIRSMAESVLGSRLGDEYVNESTVPGTIFRGNPNQLTRYYSQEDSDTQDSRRSRRLLFREKKAYQLSFRDTPGGLSIGEGLFDTTAMETDDSGPGWGIFVMSASGKIYAGEHKTGTIHHSSFLAGRTVLSAGEIKVVGGQVKGLSNLSGHYQPKPWTLMHVLHRLKSYQVPLGDIKIRLPKIDSVTKKMVFRWKSIVFKEFKASDFFARMGVVSLLGSVEKREHVDGPAVSWGG
jgi:hypothetical protein